MYTIYSRYIDTYFGLQLWQTCSVNGLSCFLDVSAIRPRPSFTWAALCTRHTDARTSFSSFMLYMIRIYSAAHLAFTIQEGFLIFMLDYDQTGLMVSGISVI